jgi:hypothetical protein
MSEAIEFGALFSLIRNGVIISQTKEPFGTPISRIGTIWAGGIDVDRVVLPAFVRKPAANGSFNPAKWSESLPDIKVALNNLSMEITYHTLSGPDETTSRIHAAFYMLA